MTNTYHIMDKAEWQKWINSFHAQLGSGYHDLPSGKILVAVSFHNEFFEEQFMANAVKDSLPNPVFEGNTPISASHVDELNWLFADDVPTAFAQAQATMSAQSTDAQTLSAQTTDSQSADQMAMQTAIATQKTAAASATTAQVVSALCKLNPGMKMRQW